MGVELTGAAPEVPLTAAVAAFFFALSPPCSPHARGVVKAKNGGRDLVLVRHLRAAPLSGVVSYRRTNRR
jgi:hypothetical protein